MKRITALLLVLGLLMGCLASAEGFANDYARMNEAAASALILALYDEKGRQTGEMSGFMAFDDSHAVTALDAVTGAAKIEITDDSGEALGTFKILGSDSDCNLAILAFDEPTGLSPLEINESGEVRRGAACVSIAA
ncbi:MAG: hypothetical protein II920_05625, partial [Clostridia bacterium]|nr:hypothetical protein [Clostridia bacterium]